MNNGRYARKASKNLQKICSFRPSRRTGSRGNKEATSYFAETVKKLGYFLDTQPFECLDYKSEQTSLSLGDKKFTVYNSPYALRCDLKAELVIVSTVQELGRVSCAGKILLMKDEICTEPLMPKNFIFYNPDYHKKIYSLLEEKNPAAIITVAARNPELEGALYPFPIIVDGDFNIPSVYCADVIGEEISTHIGEIFNLIIKAERIPSAANNVIAWKNHQSKEKIAVCAHIDAYENTPGASDNASGIVVLLLLAEMLKDYSGSCCIELIAFNGEDHYSAAGQMDYLKRYGSQMKNIALAVNIDGAGYKKGKTAFSFYGGDGLRKKLQSLFKSFKGLTEGEEWYSGDHMIFVQKGIPALAFTSEKVSELMATVSHTDNDIPDIIDENKLVTIAQIVKNIIIEL